uniref:NADH-ubiquinone oxidoreductase chain 6 n=1 Tax=Cephea cephea TaxID=880218 RepID=A0AAU6W5T8_9CNID
MISPIFAVLTIIAGIMVITSIHPVHSIIWLVLSFLGSASIFLQLQANFIALATLIIYVGAIAILFVFVLMMLNLSTAETDLNTSIVLPISIISVMTIISLITNVNSFTTSNCISIPIPLEELSSLQSIGRGLYLDYGFYFLFASIILLVGMIGSILLTLDPSSLTKRQNPFLQISRDSHNLPKNSNIINN